MFPKTGKMFPGGNDAENNDASYAAIVAGALAAELGETHRAAKIVMRRTGVSERTAKHWLAGTHGPCGGHLLVLMRESEAVLESVLAAAGRRDAIAAMRLLAALSTLTDVLAMVERVQETLPSAGALAAKGKTSATFSGRNDRDDDRDDDRDGDRDRDPDRDPYRDGETLSSTAGMNSRQSWFLEALRIGRRVAAADLEERWGISPKTARRDIATLKARGVIEFVGSRRSGAYQMSPRR